MSNAGLGGLLALALLALLLFGPRKLPGLGRSLGKGLREFKDAYDGVHKQLAMPTTTPAEPEASKPKAPDRQESAPADEARID
jgi:TatA/E family protein of Tat protein translocase